MDKYCCWFPSIGTLDLKVWEKVGAELKKEHAKGTPLPISIHSTWPLIQSVLVPWHTSDSFDESDYDSFEKPQSPEFVDAEGKGEPPAKPLPQLPREMRALSLRLPTPSPATTTCICWEHLPLRVYAHSLSFIHTERNFTSTKGGRFRGFSYCLSRYYP